MSYQSHHQRFAAASQESDIGCFLRVGHMATLAALGHASFQSMAETIAVASRADRLALVRVKRAGLRYKPIVILGHPDLNKLEAAIPIAAKGDPGTLRTYSGELYEKMTITLCRTDTYVDILFMAGADPAMTELLASELSSIWRDRKKASSPSILARRMNVTRGIKASPSCRPTTPAA